MDKAETQRFLRQQLAFAHFHLESLDAQAELHAKRAFSQAAILGLERGLLEYCRMVLNADDSTLWGFVLRARSTRQPFEQKEFKQQELVDLLGDEKSWMVELAEYGASIKPATALPSIQRTHPQLIAVSQPARSRTWLDLSVVELREILASAAELLDRHSESDVEY